MSSHDFYLNAMHLLPNSQSPSDEFRRLPGVKNPSSLPEHETVPFLWKSWDFVFGNSLNVHPLHLPEYENVPFLWKSWDFVFGIILNVHLIPSRYSIKPYLEPQNFLPEENVLIQYCNVLKQWRGKRSIDSSGAASQTLRKEKATGNQFRANWKVTINNK